MSDDLRSLLNGFAAVEETFAGAAALLALLAFLVEFVRGRAPTRSFRPLIGWLTTLLGLIATGAAAHALSARSSPPWSGENWILTSTFVLGVLTLFAGVLSVALAPSPDRARLREIAKSVEASARRSGFVDTTYVPLGFTMRTGAAWLGESKVIPLSRLNTKRFETASVTVVAGPADSGKSIELGRLVIDMCSRALNRSRPRELAIYVSAHRLPEITGPIYEETVREHLLASIAKESTTSRDFVKEYLNSGSGPRWLFVFDLGAELTREQEEQYFEALRNFMRVRNRDRAVVAVREEFPAALVVLAPRPPDLHRVNDLLERHGVLTKVKPPLADWRLAPEFANPAMITHFRQHLVNADQKSVRDMVESFITEQLDRHAAIDTPTQSLRERAETIAHRIIFGAGDPVSDEEVAPLRVANLVRVERGAFAFRLPFVGIHLAAAHLVRNYQDIPLVTMLRMEATRDVLVAALHGSDQRFVQHIIQETESLIRQSVELPDDLSSTALPPLGSFRWSSGVLHALTVLCELPRLGAKADLTPIRALIDHLLWLAVLGGGRHDREAALPLLVLASPQRVLNLYRQAMLLKYDNLTTSIIAIAVRFGDDPDSRPTFKERCVMAKRALEAWVDDPLPLRNVPADGQWLLRPLLDKVVSATKAFYVAATVLLVVLVPTVDDSVTATMLIVLAILLGFSASRLRGEAASIGAVTESLLPVMIIIGGMTAGAIAGVALFRLIIEATRLDILGVLTAMLYFLFWSWPFFAAVSLLLTPTGSFSWWRVHKVLIDLFRKPAELRRHTTTILNRFDHLKSWRRLSALLGLTVLGVSLTIDLPLRGDVERIVDPIALFCFLLIAIVIVVYRPRNRRRIPFDVLGHQIQDGSMTQKGLLAEFTERAGHGFGEFSQLIKVLASTRPGTLRNCIPVLQALDELLEFFERGGPATKGLEPNMWRYAPESDPIELREWAVTTDRARPGFLFKLATSEDSRNWLAQAIANATNEITVPGKPHDSTTGPDTGQPG